MARKIILLVLGIAIVLYICLALTGLLFAKQEIKNLTIPRNSQDIENLFRKAKRIKRDVFLARPFLKFDKNLQNKLGLIDKIIKFEPLYNELAGISQEKTYLLVMQNNAEMRPSGGIWGSYGILKIKNGKVTSLKTDDTYNLDKELVGKFPAPEEVADTIGNEWRFWNANWSPDFKVSAEQGLFFFDQVESTTKLDGVVGPNVDYILSLLEISGPVKLKDYSFDLDQNNFVQKMIYEPNSQAVLAATNDDSILVKGVKKNYILSDIAVSILNQAIANSQQTTLVEKTLNALGHGDLIFYSTNPAVQKEMEGVGWAGRMPSGGNFVYLADANLGSKLDFIVEKSMKVTKTSENRYRADLEYYNPGEKNADLITQIFKTYRSFVRLYLPKGAKLT